MRIDALVVGPLDNNVYLLRCPRTGATALVDAADEPERILAALGADPLVGILQTHGHGDHVQALRAVQQATGAPVYCHPADMAMLPAGADPRPLVDGDTFAAGDVVLDVIHLAGHTPGGLAFRHGLDLFSGDSLFPGGVGRTTPETFDQLFHDVTTKLFDRLPDETRVHPGHGRPTTLGAERPALPAWQARRW